jgi:ankyrin repeat protein
VRWLPGVPAVLSGSNALLKSSQSHAKVRPITNSFGGQSMKSLMSTFFRTAAWAGLIDKDNALHRAARYGFARTVGALLAAGADVDAGGGFALRWAASSGHTKTVEALVDSGADVHAWGDFALQCAAMEGHTETVKALLAAGADIHALGDMALQWAAEKGRTEIVQVLLTTGADVHGSGTGQTALQWAAGNGHSETERVLKDWIARAEQIPSSPHPQPG